MELRIGFRAVFCAGLLISFAQPGLTDESGARDEFAGHLKVMTQNLYVGANLFKILDGAPEDVPFTAAEIFGDTQTTDFYQRARSNRRPGRQGQAAPHRTSGSVADPHSVPR